MIEILSVVLYVVISGFTSVTLLLLVWWADRYEREPLHILLLAVLWGALPSIFLSCVFELVVGTPITMMAGKTAGEVIGTVIVAPFTEELAKGVALLLVVIIYKHEFDDVLDGIVYGTAVGIGFSLVEDFGYFLSTLLSSGVAGGGIVFFLRNVGFILNHSFFTCLTGIGFGMSRLYHRNVIARFGFPLLGFCCAVCMHATHNLLAQFEVPGLLLALFIHWTGGFGFLILIPILWAIERRWILQRLSSEVGEGYVPEAALAALPFSGRRGQIPAAVRKPLKKALIQLAFHRKKVEDGWSPDAIQEVGELRSEIQGYMA